jgi:hypothetical protein
MDRREAVVESSEKPAGQVTLSAAPATFDKVKELTRNGYVPDSSRDDGSGGILFRHDSAPDLVLHADGRIDLPVGQPAKRRPEPAPAGGRISWRRTFTVVVITIGVWFLSLAVAASVIEYLID